MNNYQFRTNWRGQLILRRQVPGWNIYTRSPGLYWRDAAVEDLKDYYEQLCKIQTPCVGVTPPHKL
jgi:hypothetical protein